MSAVTITLPDGRSWTPRFVSVISEERCIGCGRCFKVCGARCAAAQGRQ